MSPDHYSDSEISDLTQFQKNRFFKGKLMTPSDMEAEQTYHAERLHTINRFLNGKGIVHGIEVNSVTESDEGLDVTLTPGLALDGNGRPVVIEQVTTKSIPLPAEDKIYLFIEFSEAAMETIPVPDTDGAVDDETAPNRVIESFTLTYRETPPESPADRKDFDIPDMSSKSIDSATLRERLTTEYQRPQSREDDTDAPVFVAAFERTPDGNWTPLEDAPARPVVFDSEFLFDVLVDHIVDTDNPHQTPVTEEPMDVPQDVDAIMNAIDRLETKVETLQSDRQSLTRYLMRKTIKDRIRFFERLADRVQAQSGEAGRLARAIADQSTAELDGVRIQASEYKTGLKDFIDQLVALGDALEPVTTEESLEDYLRAVSELQSVVGDESPLLDQINAHDEVCEAADSLNILVDMVPDE
jgi:hypothetical protein